MTVQETLVELFARLPCDQIGDRDITLAFLKPDLDEVKALPGYKEAFALVRRAKRTIEMIEDGYPEPADQALQCLAELKRCREQSRHLTPEFEVTRDLIKKTLYPRWPGLAVDYDQRREVIERWNDVFISYTNRDALATNQTYQGLILREWGAIVDPARDKHNYIARTIAKYLEQSNTRSFVDYKVLKCGDILKDEIFDHASSSIALVQLLEPAVFNEPAPPDRNWCLEEFEAFERSKPPRADAAESHNRCFFVLARGGTFAAVAPPHHPPTYDSWIQRAAGGLQLALNDYPSEFDELRLAVWDIGRQILEARTRLFDAMLASWD